jgi:ribose 5-phosphate isomerase RpiB
LRLVEAMKIAIGADDAGYELKKRITITRLTGGGK